MIRYIQNDEHYTAVLEEALRVKRQLWIGTADIKDVYIKRGRDSVPFVGAIAELIERGVEVRLIHAKEPGPNFRRDFDRYPSLIEGTELLLCPRVHFKLFIFDLKKAYIGSANLTGAGIGMKGAATRNFEAGIFTDEKSLVSGAVNQFDSVWMGSFCAACRRKQYCGGRADWAE